MENTNGLIQQYDNLKRKCCDKQTSEWKSLHDTESQNDNEWLKISHVWGEHYVEMMEKLTKISKANKTGRKMVIDKVLSERLKMFRKMIQVSKLDPTNTGHMLSDYFQEKQVDDNGDMWWLNEGIPHEDYELPSMLALLGPGVIQSEDVRSWDWPDAQEHELITASNELVTVYIGAAVTAIGHFNPAGVNSEVLMGFNNLNCVVFELNSACTFIARRCFYGCHALRDVNFPESLSFIDSAAFGNTGLVTVDLPSSVDGIRNSAFKGCSKMKTLTLRYNEDLVVEEKAFQDCTELSVVNLIGGSPEQWKDAFMTSSNIFDGCPKLEALRKSYKQPTVVDYLVNARLLEIGAWEDAKNTELPSGGFIEGTFNQY